MSDTIWSGEIGKEYSEGSGEVVGSGVVTAVDLEEKIVTVESDAPAAATAPPQMSAEEEAAMKFTQLLPFVSKLGSALPSKKGLVRVLYALAEFPLGSRKPRLLNDSERQLFQVCMELQGFKSTVVTSIMEKNAKEQQAAEALKTAAITSPTEGSAEPGVVNE